MIEFSKEHSKAWLELMSAYQDYRDKIFNWAKENTDVKYHDLYIELSLPLLERDLHKRLLIIQFTTPILSGSLPVMGGCPFWIF